MCAHILQPGRGHRLYAIVLMSWFAGPGCFSKPKIDVGTIQCEIADDCPSGYLCKSPLHRCCRSNDATCGIVVLDSSVGDASGSDGTGANADGHDRQGQSSDGSPAENTNPAAPEVTEPSDVLDAQSGLDEQDAPTSQVDDASVKLDGGEDARDAGAPDVPPCQFSTDGTSCGEGMVCSKSQCVACSAGGSCPFSIPCHKGIWSCSTGTAVCVDSGDADEGTACGSGNVCHGGTCSACVGGGACPIAGKPCRAGVLTCSAGVALCVDSGPGNEGATCDDGNACTKVDKCQGGQCVGTNSVTCAALDTCHVVGTCDPATGQCSNPAGNEGDACNDGNACTKIDKCQNGQCVGTSPVTCAALDTCHVVGTCNTSTGQCTSPTGNEGGACSDPSTPCVAGKTCKSGVCQGGATKTCPPSDLCHTPGSCDPATGVCSNPAKTCVGKGQCYQVGTCDPSTGECSNPLQPDGYACSDSNPCTINDSCYQGNCVHGTAVECNDNAGPCYPPGQCAPNGATYTCVYSSTPYPDGTQCMASPGNWGTCFLYSTGISVCLLL